MKRKLPVGISDFKEVISEGYAYVDKTLLVKELMELGSQVALVPRPRRFGKTLNLSMLRYFFENNGEDTSALFQDLQIWKHKPIRKLQGRFPVVFLTLKDLKATSWEQALEGFGGLIAREVRRHPCLFEKGALLPEEEEERRKLAQAEAGQMLLEASLLLLTSWLSCCHGEKTIVLIDEYDALVHAAYLHGYYDKLISFLRSWLSAGLKDNPHLKKGVLTGVLRVAKESIFSGLNNVSTFTLLHPRFQDKFGLLESEVKALLAEYRLTKQLPGVRQWYDGYRIGQCAGLYNPWSILKCLEDGGVLAPYWGNTADPSLISGLLAQGPDDLKADLEQLLQGGVIQKTIDEGIVFSKLETHPHALWPLLLFSGYLTLACAPIPNEPCKLRIPNEEVRSVYRSMILDWFEGGVRLHRYQMLTESLAQGDTALFRSLFEDFVSTSFSFFDVTQKEPERVYHGFVLGLLASLSHRYQVRSNRESGLGRYDVMLLPRSTKDVCVIFEFKAARDGDLETAARLAVEQIKAKNYGTEAADRGLQRILLLGVAMRGKEVAICDEWLKSPSPPRSKRRK